MLSCMTLWYHYIKGPSQIKSCLKDQCVRFKQKRNVIIIITFSSKDKGQVVFHLTEPVMSTQWQYRFSAGCNLQRHHLMTLNSAHCSFNSTSYLVYCLPEGLHSWSCKCHSSGAAAALGALWVSAACSDETSAFYRRFQPEPSPCCSLSCSRMSLSVV